MKKPLIGLVLVFAVSLWQTAHAQLAGADRHVDALAMEQRGDERGAFLAFLEAAEAGYAPAQRRLGEIYDGGNLSVERDYAEAIRWYQKAREGGEQIPSPPARSYGPPPISGR